MSRKEESTEQFNQIPKVSLAKGKWDENLSWEFILSDQLPERESSTAVCCVTTYQNKLVLVRNKRNWEIPAGHIEAGETVEEAIKREVLEETCGVIENPQFFGYKEVVAKEPVPLRDNSGFYPNPGYVIFFHAEANSFLEKPFESDIQEVKLVTFAEAQEVLREGHQYDNVLEYLAENGRIAVT